MSGGGNNPSGGGRSLGGDSSEPLPSGWSSSSSRPRMGRIGDWANPPSAPRSGARFGSLGTMGGGQDDEEDDDEDENRGTESWFAGGERSGISVQNPNDQRSVPGGNMVRDLLRRAAQAGPPPEAPTRPSGAFSGSGHTLGSDEVESSFVAGAGSDAEETVIRHLTFWQNGFQVEDGELLRYDDPAQAQVLAEINAGHAPPAILNVQPGQHVELRVAKRTNEDYVPPKGARAFAGTGNRLGGVVPEVTPSVMPGSFTGSNPAAAAAPPASSGDVQARFEVDQSQPTTSIQIRLADGTRMVCRMNLTHTVGDIRNFINASRPENRVRQYTIGTTFPNRTLDDDTATIQGAGLVNTVVVQRWV
ncbi:hypothetical protein CVT24_013002 [Panaeolus cyanescens]|uniref:UBX domain-containing protein n=1 Tax=Panaeolus cyanescens TaxID=181874 RepID=A0A409VVR3_9AGAR|nr:hypothetical protein CVT24_013002 [Panaeolus cyanescens]